MKIKSSAKGFTLIELLVVVLIIGILSAVALPMYRKAVEKSRVADALNTMQAVAKSEHGWYLTNNSYTKDFGDLDIDLTDANGNKADNASFTNALYTYELLDNGIIAERNNGEYTLYKDYESSQILCTPGTHYICEDLGAFTKVPCEEVGMAWANTNSTCYVNDEARCKGLYDDSMWHDETNPEDSYCGYKAGPGNKQDGKTLDEGMTCLGENYSVHIGSCTNSIINAGGVCEGSFQRGCLGSTVNAGGKCIAYSQLSCAQVTVHSGGECIAETGYSDTCAYSTINAGAKCSGSANGACNNSNIDGGLCEATNGCSYSHIHNNAICSGSCYKSTISDGGVCTGGCYGVTVNDAGVCKSTQDNGCRVLIHSYYPAKYNGTGCCCGDYCGSAPKCSAERCAALD